LKKTKLRSVRAALNRKSAILNLQFLCRVSPGECGFTSSDGDPGTNGVIYKTRSGMWNKEHIRGFASRTCREACILLHRDVLPSMCRKSQRKSHGLEWLHALRFLLSNRAATRLKVSASAGVPLTFGAALVAAYLGVSAYFLWPIRGSTARNPTQVYYSTDTYLLTSAGMTDGSRRVLRAIASVSEQKSITAKFPRGSEQGVLSAFIISYLAWPRSVRLVPVAAGPGSSEIPGPGGAFFCRTIPPVEGSAERLGVSLNFFLPPEDSGTAAK
jgi:hypothetical protein